MRVAIFTIAMTALTALMLGMAPGVRFSRPDVNDALKSSSAGSPSAPGVQRMRSMLVIVQVALSVALAAAAVLEVRSVIALQTAKSGFSESQLLTFRTYVAGDEFDAPEARAAAFFAVVNGLQHAPGIDGAALT